MMTKRALNNVFTTDLARLRQTPTYRESVYATIKDAILAGQLAVNQPLVEEQLAASLNISRTPVREALALLQHEGFIGPGVGRGLYVLSLSRAEFVELFMANEVIEPYLARRAARLATAQQLAAIYEAIQQGKVCQAQGDTPGFLHASRNFHRYLGEAAGNLTLTNFVVGNEERTDMYLLNANKQVDAERMGASLHEHEAIYDALVQCDPEAASRCVIYHAQSLRERFADLFVAQADEEGASGK